MPRDGDKSPLAHSQVQALLGFARSLQTRLPSAQNDESLLAEVEESTRTAAHITQRQQIKRQFGRDLSTISRNLWNVCVRLPHHDADASSTDALRLRTRQFAFSLMHLAKWPGPSTSPASFNDIVLLLTMLFKICRLCLHNDSLVAAVDAISKASHCVALLPEMKAHLSHEQLEECRGLEAQNLCLRTALAWREGRLEVAEAMYIKTELLRQNLGPEATENFAEVLYEMGKHLAEKAQYVSAATWLGRTLDILAAQDVELLSREALNLRDAAYQMLVTMLLETGQEEDRSSAAAMVQRMSNEMGETPVILALRLETLDRAPDEEFDGKTYADTILRLGRLLESDSSTTLVEQHIINLHGRDPVMGCKAMDQLLTKQTESGRQEVVEVGILRRIKMATEQRGVTQTIFDLLKLLNGLQTLGAKSMNAATAFNAQALIWKKMGDVATAADSLALAEGWCKVACHPLLENGGQTNQAKLRRKLVTCALESGDVEAARRNLQDMPKAIQNEPLTRYLIFKLALLVSDRELALESIEYMSKSSQEPDLLYACLVHAQAHADKVVVCHTMLRLVENLDVAEKLCTPALLRCALRLLGQQLADQKVSEERRRIADQICAIYDKVLQEIHAASVDEADEPLYTTKEFDYFSKTSLNLVVKHRETLDLIHVVKMSQFCLEVIQQYPHDLPDAQRGDACLRSMWCHFMAACAMVALARCEKNRRSETYEQLRGHVLAYEQALQGRAESFEAALKQDLQGKFAHLLLFNLEATVHLRHYEHLECIIHKAVDCKDAAVMKAMADCLLRGELRPEYLYASMKVVVNGLWQINGFEFEGVARYVRCLFQALLPVDTAMCEELLGIIIEMAKEPTDVEVSFPREDVEWLVVKAWNQACDFHVGGGREDEFERWAALAATLARYVPDEGRILMQVQAASDLIHGGGS